MLQRCLKPRGIQQQSCKARDCMKKTSKENVQKTVANITVRLL